MKIEELIAIVRAEVPAFDRNEQERTVHAVIKGMGFHLSNDGEVCDPRPPKLMTYPNNNVRWRGGGRR